VGERAGITESTGVGKLEMPAELRLVLYQWQLCLVCWRLRLGTLPPLLVLVDLVSSFLLFDLSGLHRVSSALSFALFLSFWRFLRAGRRLLTSCIRYFHSFLLTGFSFCESPAYQLRLDYAGLVLTNWFRLVKDLSVLLGRDHL